MHVPHRLLVLLCALFSFEMVAADTDKPAPKPADQKLHAILVWATDEDKPAEKEEELKAIEPVLREKLKFLKWKNYFQVGESRHFTVQGTTLKEVNLSHKCKLKLRQTEKEGLQVELIGEGIPVVKKNQTMPLKDILIIGGDDKNANAWMVVIKPE